MKNFTNNPLLSILILLLLTANIVTLTMLWMHKGDKREKFPPPAGGGQAFEYVAHELGMDSTQRMAYSKLRDEHQAGQRPLQDTIRKRKDELFALLSQQNVSDSTIAVYSKRASDAEQQLDLLTFRHFQKVRAICNADQQKKFDSIIQDVLRSMAPGRKGPPPGDRRMGPPPGRDDMPPPPPNGDEQPPK